MSPQDQFAGMIAALQCAGLSRTKIAEQAHLSRLTVWRLANGESASPSFETAIKIDKLHRR
jgi:transcriptional regulator with XRE-family HTH domain